jgi:DNA-binding transcriptional ArsR family regulator
MASKKFPKLSPEAIQRVARMFTLFAEPMRLGLLQELKDGPLSVNALVEALGVSQAHVSRQLGILRDGGLLTREKRGAQVFYSIADPMVFDLCEQVCGKIARDAKAGVALLK